MFSREERVVVSCVTNVRVQLTLWSTLFLERLASDQQVTKFLTSYGLEFSLTFLQKPSLNSILTHLYPDNGLESVPFNMAQVYQSTQCKLTRILLSKYWPPLQFHIILSGLHSSTYFLKFILILSSKLRLDLPMDLYSWGFRNKFCMHLPSLPCML